MVVDKNNDPTSHKVSLNCYNRLIYTKLSIQSNLVIVSLLHSGQKRPVCMCRLRDYISVSSLFLSASQYEARPVTIF